MAFVVKSKNSVNTSNTGGIPTRCPKTSNSS